MAEGQPTSPLKVPGERVKELPRANSKKGDAKRMEKEEKKAQERLIHVRKRLTVISNSYYEKDLIEQYLEINRKYKDEVITVLEERSPCHSFKPPTQAIDVPPAGEIPRSETGVTWTNKIGVTLKPNKIYYPTNICDLVSVVNESEKNEIQLKAMGSGSSISNILDTHHSYVCTKEINKVPPKGEFFLSQKDKECLKPYTDPLFQVEAGATLKDISDALESSGHSFINLPLCSSHTIGGAISVGAHGSARYWPGLSDAVVSIDIVVTGGKMYRIEPKDGITDPSLFDEFYPFYTGLIQNDNYFRAVQVSLGCLGIIYSVILRVSKLFWLLEDVKTSTWERISKDISKPKNSLWNPKYKDDRSSFYLNPYKSQTVLLCNTKYTMKQQGNEPKYIRSFPNVLFPKITNIDFATRDVFRAFPNHSPELLDMFLKGVSDKKNTGTVSSINNAWTQPVNLIKTEVSFSIQEPEKFVEKMNEVIRLLNEMRQKDNNDNISFPIYVSFSAQSSSFMAQNYEKTVVYLEFSSIFDTKNDIQILKALQEELLKIGAVPSWGTKLIPLYGDELREHFPKFDEWLKVFSEFNGPKYTFANSFTDDMFRSSSLSTSASSKSTGSQLTSSANARPIAKSANPQISVSAQVPINKRPARPEANTAQQRPDYTQTMGPFIKSPEKKPVVPLINFQPQELHRDFPYIAKGSYGVVYKGKADGVEKTVAIKDMEVINQNSVDDWKKEITVMSQNRSKHVVEIFGFGCSGNLLTIVMEFMSRGDLYNLLHKKPEPLSLLQRVRMGRHCALGLAFLHYNHFMHRDVKSLNILITDDYTCKLTDFGCAKLVSDKQSMNTVNTGTPLWMAPEVKRGHNYGYAADVYSMGLVLYEIFERKLPGFDEVRQIAVLPPTFQSMPVIMPCLKPAPEKRPSAADVVKVVDGMISGIITTIRNNLPEFKNKSQGGDDPLDQELGQLYSHLLTLPATEVDSIIDKAYSAKPPPTNKKKKK